MIMQYQGINVILNALELVFLAALSAVFLFNRFSISEQYSELIVRLDRLIEATRGKAKNKKN